MIIPDGQGKQKLIFITGFNRRLNTNKPIRKPARARGETEREREREREREGEGEGERERERAMMAA